MWEAFSFGIAINYPLRPRYARPPLPKGKARFSLFIPLLGYVHLFDAEVAVGVGIYFYKELLGFFGIHDADFGITQFAESLDPHLHKGLLKVHELL